MNTEKIIRYGLYLFIGLNALDYITTIVALENGAHEANGLMQKSMDTFGYNGILILKVVGCLIALMYLKLVVEKIKPELYQKNAMYMVMTGNIIGALVVVNNLIVLGMLFL